MTTTPAVDRRVPAGEAAAATLLPGATIGILGTGQLGRMLALEARRSGYRVVTLGDGPSPTPCGQVADVEIVAPAGDWAATDAFCAAADVVTVEFENVPAELLARARLARPGPAVVRTCSHRLREKTFLAAHGLPTARFAPAPTPADAAAFGLPAVVKTATSGYDGKGQWVLRSPADLDAFLAADPTAAAASDGFVVEELVDLAAEVSVVVARGADGDLVTYPVIENHHERHILDWSVCPARVPADVAATADTLARRVASGLELVGVATVELFVTTAGGVLVNEIAPRPHNSGHLTIEAAPTSQFGQQLRAVCGLPLGAVTPMHPAAMANLLGDVWTACDGEPNWAAALAVPGVSLHLYGKAEPRPGRKMGHLTAVADDPDDALDKVLDARRALPRR